MPRVFVTQTIDPDALAVLHAAGLDVVLHEGNAPIRRDALLAGVVGCEGLLCMLTDRVDAAVFDAAGPGLRIVANHAVGVDNVDVAGAKARGIAVTNTPGVLTDATADLAMALLLAAARHVVPGDRMVREGRFVGWHPMLLRGLELRGATLGVVGFGRIGRAVAHRAEAFGMRIVHAGRTGGIPLAQLLADSDVVSLHCPLTPATHHLIDAAALQRMKRSAILINTARGPVVDEAALALALREGTIAAAGLDVFEREPVVHPDLLGLDNVVLAPHTGSATVATRRAIGTMAARNVVTVLGGGAPLHPVA